MTLKTNVKIFDDTLEVGGQTFKIKNTWGGEFHSIDIHDENGKFLDEYASGFALSLPTSDDMYEVADYKEDKKKVEEYIREYVLR